MFSAVQDRLAASNSATLTAIGKARDAVTEQLFHATYGSPLLHALLGLDAKEVQEERRPDRDAYREQARAKRRADLELRFDKGGPVEAALRAVIYIQRGMGSADERSFAVLKELHDAQPPDRARSMAQLKEALREQSLLLRMDEERAVAAVPALLPRGSAERARMLTSVRRLVSAQGELSQEGRRRLARIEKLFAPRTTSRSKKASANAGG